MKSDTADIGVASMAFIRLPAYCRSVSDHGLMRLYSPLAATGRQIWPCLYILGADRLYLRAFRHADNRGFQTGMARGLACDADLPWFFLSGFWIGFENQPGFATNSSHFPAYGCCFLTVPRQHFSSWP